MGKYERSGYLLAACNPPKRISRVRPWEYERSRQHAASLNRVTLGTPAWDPRLGPPLGTPAWDPRLFVAFHTRLVAQPDGSAPPLPEERWLAISSFTSILGDV